MSGTIPPSTSIDDLDVDVSTTIKIAFDFQGNKVDLTADKLLHPCIVKWFVAPNMGIPKDEEGFYNSAIFFRGSAIYSHPVYPGAGEWRFWAVYKTTYEVALEMSKFEYKKKALDFKSHFSAPFLTRISVEYCYKPGKTVSRAKVTIDPRRFIPNKWLGNAGNLSSAATASRNSASSVRSATRALNHIEDRLTSYLMSNNGEGDLFSVDHPRFVNLLMSATADLPRDHPANLSLSEAKEVFGITEKRLTELQRAGITNIVDLVRETRSHDQIDAINASRESLKQTFQALPEDQRPKIDLEPIKPRITREVASTIIRDITKHFGR